MMIKMTSKKDLLDIKPIYFQFFGRELRCDYPDLISNSVSIVMFYTPSCGACLSLTPAFQEVAKQFTTLYGKRIAQFYGCNLSNNNGSNLVGASLQTSFTLNFVPTFLIFQVNKAIKSLSNEEVLDINNVTDIIMELSTSNQRIRSNNKHYDPVNGLIIETVSIGDVILDDIPIAPPPMISSISSYPSSSSSSSSSSLVVRGNNSRAAVYKVL
ncbi:hypothetical protein [Trichoplusia ni ascovirus 2c]|uniref:hypothetical protein n=1 Tax=Trichoplusia ni ascovirus 2c TaxID=328615 RepID=UPI0000E4423F|nr:hypothetical protein TNAV2c_gp103 [Trichoplusia ni ascovirus 2c]ABF70620.1 hypothetical protein [Trichoplusia ni ascovirus 2c]